MRNSAEIQPCEPEAQGEKPRQKRKLSKRQKKTFSVKDLKKLAQCEDESDAAKPEELEELERSRPQVRRDCINGIRPCPFVRCAHHLLLDVNRDNGSITINGFGQTFDDIDLDRMPETCVLDVADRRGGNTLEVVGAILNVTRERIRQIEAKARRKLQMWRGRLGIDI